MIRLLKAPFETDEQAMDRAWWIASRKDADADADADADIAESLKWVYQKYLKVKY